MRIPEIQLSLNDIEIIICGLNALKHDPEVIDLKERLKSAAQKIRNENSQQQLKI